MTFVMPWMCLERCAENVTADLAQLSGQASSLTALAFEKYNLGPNGSFVVNNFTNVVPFARALGLETVAMVSTCCPWGRPQVIEWARELFANPKPFMDAALAAMLEDDVDMLNLDIEPLTSDNSSDSVAYAAFVDLFAHHLHRNGKRLSVDVGSYAPNFWNLTLLGQTRVDKIVLMGTYCSSFAMFESIALQAMAAVDSERLVIGLETVSPNTNEPFSPHELAERFAFLAKHGLHQIGIWSTPIPPSWPAYWQTPLH